MLWLRVILTLPVLKFTDQRDPAAVVGSNNTIQLMTVPLYSTVNLPCLASSHIANPEICEWFKDNNDLNSKGSWDLQKFSCQRLQILKARLLDSGLYGCYLSNAMDSHLSLVYLFVTNISSNSPVLPSLGNGKGPGPSVSLEKFSSSPPLLNSGPPVIIHHKNHGIYIIPVGTKLRLSCHPYGERPIRITWLKNGLPMTYRRAVPPVFYPGNLTLVLDLAVPLDDGMYLCIARNRHGSTNTSFYVEVQERVGNDPVMSPIANQIGRVGQNLTVQCVAYCDNLVHFQLLKMVTLVHHNETTNQTNVVEKFVIVNSYTSNLVDTGYVHGSYHYKVFVFAPLTADDFGKYACMAGSVGDFNVQQFTISPPPPEVESGQGKVSAERSAVPKAQQNVYVWLGLGFTLAIVLIFLVFFGRKYYSRARRMELAGSSNTMIHTVKDPFTPDINPPKPAVLDILQEMNIDPADLSFECVVGEGYFGRVYKGLWFKAGEKPKVVAVKMLKEGASHQETVDFLSEVQVMYTLGQHENLVNLLGICVGEEQPLMVLEYCMHGNLRNFLVSNRPDAPSKKFEITFARLLQFAQQTANGMKFLASNRCVHRDLAARNVLVDEQLTMKVADFGLSRHLVEKDYYRKCTKGVVPLRWMALESLTHMTYTSKTDAWSFGILLWEMFSLGCTPYAGIQVDTIYDFLRRGGRMSPPQNCTPELYSLMAQCWDADPSARPTFVEIGAQLAKIEHAVASQRLDPLLPPGDVYDMVKGSGSLDAPCVSAVES